MRRIKNINKMICKSADVHVYLSVYAAHRHTKKKNITWIFMRDLGHLHKR